MGPVKGRDFHMGQLHRPLQRVVDIYRHPLQKVIGGHPRVPLQKVFDVRDVVRDVVHRHPVIDGHHRVPLLKVFDDARDVVRDVVYRHPLQKVIDGHCRVPLLEVFDVRNV